MRRAARIDANQPGIVKELRQIPGVSVAITSALGDGYPDLTVGFRGRTYLFEIKDPDKPPSKRRLTEEEAEFFARWRGHVAKVESANEILSVLFSLQTA